MKKFTSTVLLLALMQAASAQFYYNDLVTNQQNLDRHRQYREQKVQKIIARSSSDLEAPGVEPLMVEQVYNASYSQLRTRTSNLTGKSSISNYYNPQGQLYRTVDSSENAVTTYEYQYDGRLLNQITSTSVPQGQKIRTVELHQWIYDSLGRPVKMLRIRDQADSSEIRFTLDAKGLVTEEQVFRRSLGGEKIFYYYDDQGHLTDVVRYQDKLGKLIPDFTFDYDGQGRISQKMVVQNGGMDYQVWRYAYNAQGLMVTEACYDRQKKLVGKVEYTYEMKR